MTARGNMTAATLTHDAHDRTLREIVVKRRGFHR
ncbi:hypothetical protein SAMN05444920_1552 [Nonomuraea solani]|uniref:Uncharacterized protein n=1 Tax=Nonomuraea solani TaxID=1144553 RepID=A0A1H6F1V3_9ACTN|nr:hypothetical protein SAMN05444920_1552 [Nonomuraea solani]